MNKEQILEAFESLNLAAITEKTYNGSPDAYVLYNDYDKKRRENDTYKIQLIVRDGGGEGEGEYMSVVNLVTNKVTGESAFIKHEGHYDSWDSSDYSELTDFKIVSPKETTIIVYE